MSSTMKVAAGVLAAAIGWRQATAESTASRLQFTIPTGLYRNNGYPHEEALFGIPKYGGAIAERLVHGGVQAGQRRVWTLCSSEDASYFSPNVPDTPYILMVDRGECTFASKVRRAQHLGASGVIIADNTCLCTEESSQACNKPPEIPCESVEPIMADDGSGADIAIPSFLMKKMDAESIKSRLETGQNVQTEMTWSLPSPDDRVEWSLWTSAVDASAAPFKRDFKKVVTTLGASAFFTPYYVVYDGRSYGCTGSGTNSAADKTDKAAALGRTSEIFDQSGPSTCGSLCTNKGRYCMTDPDLDTKSGVSGADVVRESLRQKCVWITYGGENAPLKKQGVGEEWWAYVNEFFSSCSKSADTFMKESCIAKAMKAAGVDKTKVDECMATAGGTENDENNAVLDFELKEKGKNSIVIVPSVYVNNVAERGGISTAAVLSTICAGYKSGTEPGVCRCAGQPNSDLVDACMHGEGSSVGSTLFLLVMVAAIMAAAGYAYYNRTQSQMRDQVRGILAEYMPLEDIDAPGSSARVPFMSSHGGKPYAVNRTKETQLV